MVFFVYILECSDKTLYTGITNNLEKRVFSHNHLKSGAKYTKARRPVTLKYSEEHESKSCALKREHVIKKLSKSEKVKLLTSN